MYSCPDNINLGLKSGEHFPSKTHKAVAITIAINNLKVNTVEVLVAIVSAILKVPLHRIEGITYTELVNEFKMPDVKRNYKP